MELMVVIYLFYDSFEYNLKIYLFAEIMGASVIAFSGFICFIMLPGILIYLVITRPNKEVLKTYEDRIGVIYEG